MKKLSLVFGLALSFASISNADHLEKLPCGKWVLKGENRAVAAQHPERTNFYAVQKISSASTGVDSAVNRQK